MNTRYPSAENRWALERNAFAGKRQIRPGWVGCLVSMVMDLPFVPPIYRAVMTVTFGTSGDVRTELLCRR